MARSLSRRYVLSSVSALPALTTLSAQSPPAASSSPADLLESARTDLKQASAALRKVRIPQLLEPSFLFRAY